MHKDAVREHEEQRRSLEAMCGQVEKTPDANGHGQAGVFNNHTGVADFEEDGSSGAPLHSTKEKQSLIRIS